MRKTKQINELNLLDKFLFDEAMEDPEITEIILSIIMGQEISLTDLPQTEKEFRHRLGNRKIQVDVWSMDRSGVVYDTEAQKVNTKDLPKRFRLYHALITGRLLQTGITDFNELNDVYVIIIAPFDLFQKGRYRYTFRMACEEVPGLYLDDGMTTIFLNTQGTDPEDISPELRDLLQLFERTTATSAEGSSSARIHRLYEKIQSIRENEQVGIRYMNRWEERIQDREEGRIEGIAEGRIEGIAEGRIEGLAEGRADLLLTMLRNHMDDEDIIKYTGISSAELLVIKNALRAEGEPISSE